MFLFRIYLILFNKRMVNGYKTIFFFLQENYSGPVIKLGAGWVWTGNRQDKCWKKMY